MSQKGRLALALYYFSMHPYLLYYHYPQDLLTFYTNMSQHNSNHYEQIIQQQQKEAAFSNTGTTPSIASSRRGSRSSDSRVFPTQHWVKCRSGQATNIQQESRKCFRILNSIQIVYLNNWKKNVLEDLKAGVLEYVIVGIFLVDLKREFGRGDNEIIKVAELKKVKQGSRAMKEFVQEFVVATTSNKH